MMTIAMKRFSQIFIILIYSNLLYAQRATLDWKVHNVGKVRQLITNMGVLWAAGTDYPGLIYCEFPPNSSEEHIGEAGIWVAAITSENDTLVSATTIWADPHFEFYPSADRDDTIWVATKGDTIDIPYCHHYSAVSDQDFICKYSDYYIRNIGDHVPLYLDVIQFSYAWSSPPLDEIIVFDFYVIPTKIDLHDSYMVYWMDGNVGYCTECRYDFGFALDDLSLYYPQQNLAASIDPPAGVDGLAYSPLGVKVYPPDNLNIDSLRWTFNWYPGGGAGGPADRDGQLYQQVSTGVIMENQQSGSGSQYILSFGPLEVLVGDTVHFRVGLILGDGEQGMLKNAKLLDWLVEQDFKVPSPPPLPPLSVEIKSQQVILKWSPQSGDVNPETYKDPYRADNVAQPFEGYRIYKSTRSATGPWTLLAEYDLSDNEFFQNTGLEYEYTDVGLLNNLEYYYTVTAFSKPDTAIDYPSLESSKNTNAKTVVPGTEPPGTVGKVAVVPNPYRGDVAYHTYDPPWEKPGGTRNRWMEQDRRIQFINLPAECDIQIYTLAGDLVATIKHNNPDKGYEDWSLTSDVGQAISSGIYLFTVKDLNNSKVQAGKFVVIK